MIDKTILVNLQNAIALNLPPGADGLLPFHDNFGSMASFKNRRNLSEEK
jgi:hypothetical protein